VNVRELEYCGWTRAVEIRNAGTRVVVVPEIGRILSYGFVDGPNVLFEDPALAGRMLPGEGRFHEEAGAPEWLNFGGDKVWPTEQSRWPETNGLDWPPDPWFDGGAHSCTLLPDGVSLTSAVSRFNGARITRTLRLASAGTRLSIDQRIEKVQAGMNPQAEPIPFTMWSVTQIRTPEQVLLPLRAGSRHPGRWRDYAMDGHSCAHNVALEGDVAVFRPASSGSQKIGVDAGPWLAGIVDGHLMAQRFRFDTAGVYPDGGLSATVFTCPSYAELELMSPFAPLAIGQTLDFPIAWELHRLPGSCGTAASRRVAALALLSAETGL
jgi:hypothetical protein